MIVFLQAYNGYYDWDSILTWSLILLLAMSLGLLAALVVHIHTINRLKADAARLDKENLELKGELMKSHEEITKKQMQNEELMKYALSCKINVEHNDVLSIFQDAAHGKRNIKDDEWEMLFSTIDSTYPEFRRNILDNIKRLSKPVLQTAYLIKMGMSNSQITNIMNTPPQTVWYRVKKIMEATRKDFELNPEED